MAIATSTALAIAAAAAVASAGVTAYGQVQQGKTAKEIAKVNAQTLKNRAIREDQESRENASRMRIRNRQLQARQRALVAKSGIIEEGSPLAVLASQAGDLEMAVLDERRASRYKQTNLEDRARQGVWAAGQEAMAQNIAAGASLLRGASQAVGYSV